MNAPAEHPDRSECILPLAPGHAARVVRAIEHLCSTRLNAQLGLVADLGTSAVLLGLGTRHTPGRSGALFVLLGGGLFCFSFFEYALHRWLFHGPIALFRNGHALHHLDPNGHDALPFFFAPLAITLAAAALHRVMPEVAYAFAGAFAAGYAAYGASHWLMHAMRFRQPWLRRWAASHHIHHFHAGCNFGVTSPLWDVVLGTRRERSNVHAIAPGGRR